MPQDKVDGAWTVEHGAYSIGRAVEQQLRPQLDLGSGIEILLGEGDLFIVDPMMLHVRCSSTADTQERFLLPGCANLIDIDMRD